MANGKEYIKELRRHTIVSRLRVGDQDVLQPLAADSVVRVFRENGGQQAWRMEIASINRPASTAKAPAGVMRISDQLCQRHAAGQLLIEQLIAHFKFSPYDGG